MATLGEYLGAGASTTKLLLHLNGNSNDSSGNGNNGNDYNITYSQANGKFRQGAGFNGSSSAIMLLVNFFSNYSGNFTISVWSYVSSIVQDVEPIFCEGDTGGNPVIQLQIKKGKPEMNIFNVDWYVAASSSDVPINQWNNLIGIKNGTTLQIYLNGVLVGSSNCSSSTNVHPGNVAIGKYVNPAGYFYAGSIDEIIVENVAWSAEKIKKYYTMTKGRFGIT